MTKRILTTLAVLGTLGSIDARPAFAQASRGAGLRAEFLKLCEVACEDLKQDRHRGTKPVPFYEDSYAVRALAVAYDMTGERRYLDACRQWSDRMVDLQSRMVPKGAYYMNYNRKPGEKEGGWYAADSASIATGVLATAVRCTDSKDKERYLNSVKSFAKLVMDNYIGEAGGITDGLWPRYGGEWWCSSGIIGSLAFLLYEETGDERYREVGLGAIDWLNRLDLTRVKFNYWKDGAPSVVMYVLEAYSAGLPHLKPGTPTHKAAIAQIAWTHEWMSKNQQGRAAKSPWDYNSQWGSKLGGLPFHMYVYARHVPGSEAVSAAADQELRHVSSLLFKDKEPTLSQLAAFAMMSYAEKLRPGAIYRKSGPSE
jgi:hypothetical protein